MDTTTTPRAAVTPARQTEFLANMGMLMCLVALSIDSILPALGDVEQAFNLSDPNARQWMLTALFMGFAAGQLFFGPLGDRFGRKPIIALGMGIALLGTLLSVFSTSYDVMIAGRVLQGFGIAAPRILSVAMVRDRFVGAEMARAMALVSTVFMLAPVVAPGVGQLLLYVVHWRMLFVITAIIGVIGVIWLLLRHPESLPEPVPLRPAHLVAVARQVLTHKLAMGYTVAGACMYGGMLGYIAASQQIYQEIYDFGGLYALIVGAHGALIAIMLWVNRPLTRHFALVRIVQSAALFMIIWASAWTALILLLWQGDPPFWVVFIMVTGMSMAVGPLFGNLQSISLEPLGHIAGNASAVQNSIGVAIALSIAAFIGAQLGDRFQPIAIGYVVTSLLTLGLMLWASGGWSRAKRSD